jgi:hypothetical protein
MSENKNEALNAPTTDEQAIGEPLQLLALKALKQEEQEWQQDHTELMKYQATAQNWLEKSVVLSRGLQEVTVQCAKVLEKAEGLIGEQETNLNELIQGRMEGLKLIVNKMLVRVAERSMALTEQGEVSQDMGRADISGWVVIIGDDSDEEQAQKNIASHLKQAGHERYKVVTLWRDLAAKRRKDFLGLVEKQVLPIADGIYDGKKHLDSVGEGPAIAKDHASVAAVQEELEGLPNMAEGGANDMLANVYVLLGEYITTVLTNVGVTPISVKYGEAMDYEQHEPFDVEADPSLEDEHIKTVVRAGYEYMDIDTAKVQVLRAAQVIVVKN